MNLYIFLDDVAYFSYMRAAAADDNDVAFNPMIKSKLLRKIFSYHFAWSINEHINLPFKSFWYKFFLRNFKYEKESYIILCENHPMAYDKGLLTFIKRKYPTTKLIFYFMNPIDEYIYKKVELIRCKYDLILTFNEEDSIRYGYTLFTDFPVRYPNLKLDETKPIYDLFFVGASKGRLSLLINIYDQFVSKGLTCLFYINKVKKEDIVNRDGIIYNQWIDYDDVLHYVANSRCVLELLQEGMHYVSIRTAEALQYNKKLLTNNHGIVNQPFYSSSFVYILNDNEIIDTNFISRPVDSKIFEKALYLTNYNNLKTYLHEKFKCDNK